MIGEIELEHPETQSSFEPQFWHGFSLLDKVIVLSLPLLALFVALLPYLNLSVVRNLGHSAALRPFVGWLINDSGHWIVAGLLMAIWAGYLYFKRQQITNDKHVWVDAGCPRCQEYELVRVSRHRWDRPYSWLGVPAYRYACRECTWRGLRIGRRHRKSYEYLVQDEFALAALGATGVQDIGADLASGQAVSTDSFVEELPSAEHEIATGTPLPNEDEVSATAEPKTSADDSFVALNQEDADEGMDWLWDRLSDDK